MNTRKFKRPERMVTSQYSVSFSITDKWGGKSGSVLCPINTKGPRQRFTFQPSSAISSVILAMLLIAGCSKQSPSSDKHIVSKLDSPEHVEAVEQPAIEISELGIRMENAIYVVSYNCTNIGSDVSYIPAYWWYIRSSEVASGSTGDDSGIIFTIPGEQRGPHYGPEPWPVHMNESLRPIYIKLVPKESIKINLVIHRDANSKNVIDAARSFTMKIRAYSGSIPQEYILLDSLSHNVRIDTKFGYPGVGKMNYHLYATSADTTPVQSYTLLRQKMQQGEITSKEFYKNSEE